MADFVLFLISLIIVSAAAQLNLEVNIGTHHKLVECRHGTFIVNTRDTWIGRSLDVYGEWSETEIGLLAVFLEEGDVVADVGANIGSFTIPMAKMVGNAGKVVAFEAQRVLSQLLSANLVLNELTNVGVYNAGVGNSGSPIEVPNIIYSEEANFGSISLLTDWKGHGASTSLVPQVTLDDIFVDQCPSFVKIDVEGMELMVLGGGQQTLMKCHPVLFVENNCKKESKELIEFVSSMQYTCHWQVNPYFSPNNFRENKENIFPETANSINMLCYSQNNPIAVEKAKKLPGITRIDVASRRYLLNEYTLRYTSEGNTVLSQSGTMDSCER